MNINLAFLLFVLSVSTLSSCNNKSDNSITPVAQQEITGITGPFEVSYFKSDSGGTNTQDVSLPIIKDKQFTAWGSVSILKYTSQFASDQYNISAFISLEGYQYFFEDFGTVVIRPNSAGTNDIFALLENVKIGTVSNNDVSIDDSRPFRLSKDSRRIIIRAKRK